jgi:DNA polymerase-1
MKNNNNKNSKYYKHYTYHVNWMTYNKNNQSAQSNNQVNNNEDIKNVVKNNYEKKFLKPSIEINTMANQSEQVWIIIDASSILFRYFFANTECTNSKNQNINAINGFCRIVLSFLHSPLLRGKVIVVFDGAKKNFKKNFDMAYKGKRKALPDTLKEQLLLAEEFCIQSKIFFDKHILYEADDLIASYATQLNGKIYIVAYDKDFFQLVDERIALWDYRKHSKIDRQWIFEKYGVYPEHMVDFLCLVGDMSDNLHGVVGIGKKKAAALLLKYHSLDNIIQSPVAQQYDLQPAVKLKKIIQLKTDIDIKNFEPNDYVDFIKMNEFLSSLEINSMMYK